MAKKMCKCFACSQTFNNPDVYTSHIEKKHFDLIIPGMSPAQSIYFLKTKKEFGKCVMCGNKTQWNDTTLKYNRFCNNPMCKQKYVEEFRNRMIGKYGKITLLNDPEQQKLMLSHRSISGMYKWTDSISETGYTASYERAFLEYLDIVMDYCPDDIIGPSPHTYYYEYEGERHFYIPDFYMPSLNLEVEIKDGGDNVNMHGKIQTVDKIKEKLKDEVMISNKNNFNYLKITNKDHSLFFRYLVTAKMNALNGDDSPIIILGK